MNDRFLGRCVCAGAGVTALVILVLQAGRWAAAEDPSSQMWLISTRCASHCGIPNVAKQRIDYWRLDGRNHWQRADQAGFLAGTDRRVPTVVFVHGNRCDMSGALEEAWAMHRQVKKEAGGRPFRFVCWAWPSDRTAGRNRPDVQLKAAYSDLDAFYLAAQLNRLDPQAPVCLIGYSFGTRVITGALHLLAGGQFMGRNLEDRNTAQRRPMRAVLVAAAADADWLLPGHRDGLAMTQVDRMLITRNCCDRVLRWYPAMYRRGGPQAMGYVGPAGCDRTGKIEVLDVTAAVGRVHKWDGYVAAVGGRRRLAHYTFLDPPR